MIKIKNSIDFPDTLIYVVDVQDISLGEIANIKPHGNFENELQHSHISRTMKYLITLLINNKLEYKEEFSSINDRKGSSIMIKFTHILKINKQHFYLMIEKIIDETLITKDSIESSSYYTQLRERDIAHYPSTEELIEKWVVCESPIESAHLVMQLRNIFIIKKRNEAQRVRTELLNRNANSSDFFNNVNSYVFIEDRNRIYKTPEKEEEEQVDSEERNLPIRKNVTATDFTDLSNMKEIVGRQIDYELQLKENSMQRVADLLLQLRPFEQELQSKRELLMEQVKRHQQELDWFDKPYVPTNLTKEKYSLTVDPFEKELPIIKEEHQKSSKFASNIDNFFEFLYYLFDSKGFWLLALIVATLVIISSLIFRHKH